MNTKYSFARRHFLETLGLTGLVSVAKTEPLKFLVSTGPADLKYYGYTDPDEAYWVMVKRQFHSSPGKTAVNSANLCPAPQFVVDEVASHYRNLVGDVSFQNRAKLEDLRKRSLSQLASFLHVGQEDIGITRNTSEANNIVVNGLDIGPGDEVLVWKQNHPSNLITWKMRARRMGFSVKEFQVNKRPKTTDELTAQITANFSPNTRILAFSHISNVSGIALPATDICKIASSRGIMTLVDGAQALGCVQLNLAEMNCSFYTASTHKWLMGPMENGLLYVHPDHKRRLWPNIIAAGWEEDSKSVDDRLCVLGQRNTPSTAALPGIIDFHNTIGAKRIEDRIRKLNTHLKTALTEHVPGISFVTPLEESLSAGVTIFNLPEKNPLEVFQELYQKFGIASAPTGGIRISPTINSTIEDIDHIVEALVQISQS